MRGVTGPRRARLVRSLTALRATLSLHFDTCLGCEQPIAPGDRIAPCGVDHGGAMCWGHPACMRGTDRVELVTPTA